LKPEFGHHPAADFCGHYCHCLNAQFFEIPSIVTETADVYYLPVEARNAVMSSSKKTNEQVIAQGDLLCYYHFTKKNPWPGHNTIQCFCELLL
jgi:hypothetical protein